jgi:ADP-ribosylglycohydrolase
MQNGHFLYFSPDKFAPMKRLQNAGFLILLFSTSLRFACQSQNLNEAEFRDKIHACWLGKNIGGTLGMPFEGKTDLNNLTFYTNLKSGEPAANDDLDLQILWLKALEENNATVNAYTLGQYWLKYVPVDWNEYGVGKKNMKMGIMPPLSGEYNNVKWKNSNGAWIRSEIWACLAPGNPMLAARFAWEDACVDHGVAEGTIAEIFTASLESAAFIESDRNKLIEFALAMIPGNSKTAIAVRTATEARKAGKDWQTARLEVIRITEDLGWFQAPRNVAFTMIGFLWGEGDFGKSICIAVNCGDDTDCTGATLGSILGIIGGTKTIPDKWREPVGDKIVTVAISGFDAPKTLNILTDNTLAMAKKMSEMYKMPLRITADQSRIDNVSQLLKIDQPQLNELLNRSPYRIIVNEQNLSVTVDYLKEPLITENSTRPFKLSVKNTGTKKRSVEIKISGLAEGSVIRGLPMAPINLSSNAVKTFDLVMDFNKTMPVNKMAINLSCDGKDIEIPFVLINEKN